jgi:hypothetical protein
MRNTDYINKLVNEQLGGDKSRLPELFEDESVFMNLQKMAVDSDWYHFELKSYDGCYLVRCFPGFQVYEQERGVKSNQRVFSHLSEAAAHFFNTY